MLQRDRVDLDWSTLFNVQKDKEYVIHLSKTSGTDNYNAQTLQSSMMENIWEVSDDFSAACEIAALKFCIEDTSFAQDVLQEKDYNKVVEVYSRKQFNSKALKNLLSVFLNFLITIKNPKACGLNGGKFIPGLFTLDIYRALHSVLEDNIKRAYPNLKIIIDKVTSGVKVDCYVDATNSYLHYAKLDKASNDYVKEKFDYDFNEINTNKHNSLVMFENKDKLLNLLMGLTFINDLSFWEEHPQFNWFTFIESVRRLNGARHAEKLLDYIFTEILKDEFNKNILANNLEMIYIFREEFVHLLEWRTRKLIFERFQYKYEIFAWYNGRCYPFSESDKDEENIRKGEKLFAEFIADVYPDNKQEISEFIFKQIANPEILSNEKNWTLIDILEAPTFGYYPELTDKQAVMLLCPNYFSQKNILNRVYLTAYEVGLFTRFNQNEVTACLFDIYYDVCQFIIEKLGIPTKYQRDVKWRDDNFCALRDKLKEFDVSITENFKSDYIISLLDRKVAIREESERFPVLEQLGDAIYGLAVAELIFYNPDADGKVAQNFESFIKAESQIKISKKFGLDKLYISASSLPSKHYRDTVINPDTDVNYFREEYINRDGEKYLADSLEMIIGTICKDCGFDIALNFSKAILKQTFPDIFKEEVHFEDNKTNEDIDWDYYNRILPGLYQRFDGNLEMLWRAFNKAFLVMALGTENKNARRFITNSFGDMAVYGDKGYGMVNRVFHYYLNNGWDKTFKKYSEFVKQNCIEN